MAEKYSYEISRALRDYLDGIGRYYNFDMSNGIIHFGLDIGEKIRYIQCALDIYEDNYNVLAVLPLSADRADQDQMNRMAEFIRRVNNILKSYILKSVNFELDYNDGEIRYKHYVDCVGITLSQEMIRQSIQNPDRVFKRYSKGFVKILFSDMSAKEAVFLCERDRNPFYGIEEAIELEWEPCTSGGLSRILDIMRMKPEEDAEE